MFLLSCTLLLGFSGYSLVFEQLSYWGATVGSNITSGVPVVGPWLKELMLGGEVYNDRTLSRLFIVHAAVLPVLTVVLVATHITIIRLQGVTEFQFEDEAEEAPKHFSFFPDHFLTEIVIGLILMVLLTTLATIFPAEMGPRADPLSTPEVIKPEWFFYVSFRWLKLMPATAAILSTGFIVFVMFAWPFIDGWIRRRRPGSEASVWVGTLAVLVIIGFTVWEAVVAH
jgi:quinol-cytochrome oxidoreductase complex cytochrome b subunit